MKVSILNLNCGNLSSISNAFDHLQIKFEVTSDEKKINQSDIIVLPGNGNFNHVMNFIRKKGLDEVLHENLIIKKKPFLGICIGFQILFTSGIEDNVKTQGLNFLDGNLTKLQEKLKTDNFSLPHIGWNNIEIINRDSILNKLSNDLDFYFMHSYVNKDLNNKFATSICEYGEKFISSVEKENITAIQFHPEKSHDSGISFLREWIKINA